MPDYFPSDSDSLFRSNFISRVKAKYYLIVLSQFIFSDYWRKLIGKHLVDPQNLLHEGELGEDYYYDHMLYFKHMQF